MFRITKSYKEFFAVNGLYLLAVTVNFVVYFVNKKFKGLKISLIIFLQLTTFILFNETLMASIRNISEIDSEPVSIAVFASLSFLHFNASNMFITMTLCFFYYCLRMLSRLGEDATFRILRSCIFNCVGFIYIFFFTRYYLKIERENFMKHHNLA